MIVNLFKGEESFASSRTKINLPEPKLLFTAQTSSGIQNVGRHNMGSSFFSATTSPNSHHSILSYSFVLRAGVWVTARGI